ncbi:MAG: AAA family ATPase [Chloroflexi bacterium]|nr:AAA family ATPase [Chloroflexota bacterium]
MAGPAERRPTVTLVTSDLKGSTALGERLDPEALREVLNRYFSVMRVVFESHGGRIEKIIGDAIVAVFGLPEPADDDALRAVEAAAESMRALATLNDELEAGWGVRLVTRTGVASGEVTFGEDLEGQHVLLGPTVEISGVMEQNAPPLEVLLAESTRSLVADAIEVEVMEPVSPKGSTERLPAFRLVAVREREGHAERPLSAAEAVARDSRRTVSLVFALAKVHATTGEEPGPGVLRDVMSRYFDAMRTALEHHGGTVEKYIGDAVMAVFGLPVRHEDDALRAVRAAADMQDRLADLNVVFRTEFGLELDGHIGVNTGEVIATGDATSAQRLVTGDTVNTAARLEQAAGGGEIVLGELTHRLAREEIEVEPIPPLTLKGKAEPVPAYRLVRVGRRSSTTSATPFVGRASEMARLRATLAGAIGSGRAGLVSVVGDAGVGKSRLIREFAEQAADTALVLRGRCLPYGNGITFWPLNEAVGGTARIESDDSPAVAIGKIRSLLLEARSQATPADIDEVVDRVAAAINLTTAQFPVTELLWGARRLLEILSRERPLVFIIDDLQSAEATFLDLLDAVIESSTDARIVLLCSARREIAERHPDWSEAHAADTITLTPLSDAEAGTVVEELLGALDDAVRARIAMAAEGNPLYLEQIVSMLVETRAIERDGDRWVTRAGTDQLAIPPTVQALVAARLDALGSDERQVIEPASVIGLAFPEEALGQLVEETVRPDLDVELSSLAMKELIRRVQGGELVYRFGHGVIRDTAYGGLLKRVRAALHERFVVWAERVNRERGRETEFEEILGYHLEQAYRYRTEIGVIDDHARDVADRAAAKLGNAGRRALDRSDLSAATSLLARAIALQEKSDRRRVELLIELSEAHLAAGGLDDARAAAREAIEDATVLEDERLVMLGGVADWVIDVFLGAAPPAETLERAQRAVDLFERLGDEGALARAWRLMAWQHGSMGRVDDAANDCLHGAEHGVEAGDKRIANRAAMGYATYAVNGSLPASDVRDRCLTFLDAVSGDRRAEAVILGALAQLRAMDGEFDEARTMAERARQLLLDLGPSAIGFATSIEASRVEMLAGNPAAAEELLRRDSRDLETLGETYFRSTIVGKLAIVLASAGRADEAIEASAVAEELSGSDDIEAQILWRLGRSRALIAKRRLEEADELAARAVELAVETASPVYLADALTTRGDVLIARDRPAEAAPLYDRAVALYRSKGDRVSAAALERRLAPTAQGRRGESGGAGQGGPRS